MTAGCSVSVQAHLGGWQAAWFPDSCGVPRSQQNAFLDITLLQSISGFAKDTSAQQKNGFASLK